MSLTTAETGTGSAGIPQNRGHARAIGEAVAGYRLLGWQVTVTEQGVFLPLGPATTALAMPARIGSRVLADLKSRMLAAEQVPAASRWIRTTETASATGHFCHTVACTAALQP